MGKERFERIKPEQDRMDEACGVLGIYNQDDLNLGSLAYFALHALQHRGQESCGMAVAGEQGIRHHKGIGLVADVFGPAEIEPLQQGNMLLGHVRYGTREDNIMANAQPLVVRSGMGEMALAYNGIILNAQSLCHALQEGGAIFQSTIDLEMIAYMIAQHCHTMELPEALQAMMLALHGAYSMVLMTGKQLIGMRDPMGFRPLALGQKGQSYVLASETTAFDAMDAAFIRDIEPGEIVFIDQTGVHSIYMPSPRRALCIFEHVYFARTDSVIDGVSVYEARRRTGRLLARKNPVEADIVAGVPDSALPAAVGYAEESGIPYGEALAKNRYIGRTFIQPDQSQREQSVRIKLNVLKNNVEGKRVVLVDDSIVRGTTSRNLTDMLRAAGATEVHFRICSPPVLYPCVFGIHTPSKKQLISAMYTTQEICTMIGADSLAFAELDGLKEACFSQGCDYCAACFDGEYPIKPE